MGVELILTRWWTDCDVQLGRLAYPGGDCFTLEDRWRWNRADVSCIPTGYYWIERDTFRGKYENFKVLGVMDRVAIEMHRGNTEDDTSGCILLGASLIADPVPRLGDSKVAFDRFMEAMEGVNRARFAIVGPLERAFARENRHG